MKKEWKKERKTEHKKKGGRKRRKAESEQARNKDKEKCVKYKKKKKAQSKNYPNDVISKLLVNTFVCNVHEMPPFEMISNNFVSK